MYSFQNNQLILDKWAKRAHIRKEGEISPDGVYYKGSRYHFESNGKIFCERERGDEDALWNNSLRRILFISKDSNESSNPYDMRCCELTHNPDGSLSFGCRFVNNMLRLTAGLASLSKMGFITFDEINKIDYLDEIWEKTAVARINVKKHSGGPSISSKALSSAIEAYSDYIIEQILLLNANIIVCCGGSSIIKNFVVNNIYNDAERTNNWIYYSPIQNAWIIDSYHLQPRSATTDEALYTNIMSNFCNALKKKNLEPDI